MYHINQDLCNACGACEAECPDMEHKDGFRKCVSLNNGQYTIDCEHCTGCEACVRICMMGAVEVMESD